MGLFGGDSSTTTVSQDTLNTQNLGLQQQDGLGVVGGGDVSLVVTDQGALDVARSGFSDALDLGRAALGVSLASLSSSQEFGAQAIDSIEKSTRSEGGIALNNLLKFGIPAVAIVLIVFGLRR